MADPKARRLEIRLLVIVTVDLTSDELIDALKHEHRQPSSVAEVVGAEVISNLESVPYVDVAIASVL
jgi:hypothetical protein